MCCFNSKPLWPFDLWTCFNWPFLQAAPAGHICSKWMATQSGTFIETSMLAHFWLFCHFFQAKQAILLAQMAFLHFFLNPEHLDLTHGGQFLPPSSQKEAFKWWQKHRTNNKFNQWTFLIIYCYSFYLFICYISCSTMSFLCMWQINHTGN